MTTVAVNGSPAPAIFVRFMAEGRLVLEQLFVSRLVKSHHQRSPLPQRRRAQVSCRPEQQRSQSCEIRFFGSQIHMNDFFAPGRIDFIDIAQQFERLLFCERRFFGVCFGSGRQLMFRKKLLRFSAGASARPVIAPIDFFHNRRDSRPV